MFLTIYWRRGAHLFLMLTTIWDGGTIFQYSVLRVRYSFYFIILTRADISTDGFWADQFSLDSRENKTRREFLIETSEYNVTTIKISFQGSQATRNTGLRVSWSYSPPQITRAEPRFVADNKLFILLANVLHQQRGVTAHMEREIRDIIREGFQIIY